MALCRNGHEVADGQKFCPECGVALEESSAPDAGPSESTIAPPVSAIDAPPPPTAPIAESGTPTTTPEAPPKRRTPWVPIIIGALVLLLVVGYFVTRATSDTKLEKAYNTCYDQTTDKASVASYAQLGDGGKSLTLDGPGQNSAQLEPSLTFTECVLNEVHRPDYVWSQMQNTTSLAGQQTAQWEDISASWTYHPDNGFDVVLHLN